MRKIPSSSARDSVIGIAVGCPGSEGPTEGSESMSLKNGERATRRERETTWEVGGESWVVRVIGSSTAWGVLDMMVVTE